MNTIERYILFAIENNWITNKLGTTYKKIRDLECLDDVYFIVDIEDGETATYQDNVIETLTSKKFIEAVTRGYWNMKEGINGADSELFEMYLNKITTQQAIAIRDNKLEEFIEQILPSN